MIFLLIFSQVFLLSNQKNYTGDFKMQVEKIFVESDYYGTVTIYCPNKKSKIFHFKGRTTNIKDIININISKYKSYSSVLINDKIDQKEINKFPKSTIFFVNKKYENYTFQYTNKNSHCFIIYNDYYYHFDEVKGKYYIFVGPKMTRKYEKLHYYFLVLFSLAIIIVFYLYFIRGLCDCKFIIKIEVNYIAKNNLYFSVPIAISCFFFEYAYFTSIAYTIYKYYMIVNLIYLLTGYKIIYFKIGKRKKLISTILLTVIESFIRMLFLYIIYYIPSLDNFYLFFAKALIEHLIIFMLAVKLFFDKFIFLYKQYRLQRRIRRIIKIREIFTLAYKYKLLIYIKVFIFSILYSLAFIALKIIQISYHINYYYNGVLSIYYMDVSLEFFFILIFAIIFFPLKNSILYFLPVKSNINFITQIKEDNLQINNLSKKSLRETYIKKEYPLILLEPFAKVDRLSDDCNIHLGISKTK